MECVKHYINMNGSDVSKGILVWVTDSMSSAWAIFKGRCREPESFNILCEVLELYDKHKVLLLALWVPRELADFISHLSCYVSRENVSGRGSQLETIIQQSYWRNSYVVKTNIVLKQVRIALLNFL
jgi:hypothetical protein